MVTCRGPQNWRSASDYRSETTLLPCSIMYENTANIYHIYMPPVAVSTNCLIHRSKSAPIMARRPHDLRDTWPRDLSQLKRLHDVTGCEYCFRLLRGIALKCPSVTSQIQSLVSSLVLSRLDCCNATLAAGILSYLIQQLQSVVNLAVRLVFSSSRFDHIPTFDCVKRPCSSLGRHTLHHSTLSATALAESPRRIHV